MRVHIFTLPFEPGKDIFDDAELNKFLLNKQIKSLRAEFFLYNDRPYWTVFVYYELHVSRDEKKFADLNDHQKLLYQRLREWRKERADTDGIPVFIIATNQELAELTRRAPRNPDGLRQIHGFGKKKLEKYGKELLDIISAFSDNQQSTAGDGS